jgi:hypothetical protein
MAREEESFETLVKEAPLAPAAGTVSLVGTLARSAEAGKFVLTLQDGRTVTLETAAVKGYMVLGTSVGQTIVRIDVDPDKVRLEAEASAGPHGFGAQVPAGAVAPFALATPQQLPPATLAALEFPNAIPAYGPASPLGIGPTYPLIDNSMTLPVIDIYLTLPLPDHIHSTLWIDHPGTGGPRLD